MNEYKKLTKQPIKFVLAEFRFSPVMQIEGYIPKLQEKFRREYPHIMDKNVPSMSFDNAGVPSVKNIGQWAFISKDRRSGIEITTDRMVFITKEYHRFQDFEETCKLSLDILSEIVDPILVERIGLRYGDLIEPENGEKITDLIDSSFDIPENMAVGSHLHSSNETIIETTEGYLVIRTLNLESSNITVLPDLREACLDLEISDYKSKRLILDIDHAWSAKSEDQEFDISFIISKINALHKISREAFWNITTDQARNEKWA